jgi:hypothetical protein
MSRKKKNVLEYSPKKASQATVLRHYEEWRKEHGKQMQCDNPDCTYNKKQHMEWNGKPLGVILDHINGSRYDNSPGNLRYLCPNCDSQLSTRGGRNRGRILELREGTYIILNENRAKCICLPTSPGSFVTKGTPATLEKGSGQSRG